MQNIKKLHFKSLSSIEITTNLSERKISTSKLFTVDGLQSFKLKNQKKKKEKESAKRALAVFSS